MYTGTFPYAELRDGAATVAIREGKMPAQPPDDVLPVEVWNYLVTPCMSPAPGDRPIASVVLVDIGTLNLDDAALMTGKPTGQV